MSEMGTGLRRVTRQAVPLEREASCAQSGLWGKIRLKPGHDARLKDAFCV
jgi:hypothetical protein